MLGELKMTGSNTQDTAGVRKQQWMAASFCLACAVVAGALSALNIIRRLNIGFPSSHPWSTTASIVIPVALVFLAIELVSAGPRKRILAIIVILFGLTGTICGVLALVA
jgi:hypothetical protein